MSEGPGMCNLSSLDIPAAAVVTPQIQSPEGTQKLWPHSGEEENAGIKQMCGWVRVTPELCLQMLWVSHLLDLGIVTFWTNRVSGSALSHRSLLLCFAKF